jgi:radical SAM superfamily enzyme YgiQ (UPF0313 family)
MKIHFIYPRWPKIPEQTPFTLPPLGVIQAAACVPEKHEVALTDENVQDVDLDHDCDLAGISIMLSCQAPRAYELAAGLRARGKTVVMGGQHVTLCPDETAAHADAVVVGEGEGLIEEMVADAEQGRLKKVYRSESFPSLAAAPLPRRDLLDKARHYNYRGWEMVDLVQTSRGCRFNCYPCSVGYLEGQRQRTRSIEAALADVERCGERIFLVDNSLDQDLFYQKRLLGALAGAGKRWISHPIHPDAEMMKLARRAGWWYVYLAVYKMNDQVRDRIKMYHDHGIGVEGTIMFGLDYHTEDFIRRLIDFLLTVELDLAEFTVLTPFPHTRCWRQLEREGRIIDRDWSHYNATRVVFKPYHMSPERLQELYEEAWEAFYGKESQTTRMGKLLLSVLKPSRRRRGEGGKA